MIGTVGRVTRTDRPSAVPETRVTSGNHRPVGSGDSRPVSAASPGSAPAREGEAQPTPRARTFPPPIPPLRPWPWWSSSSRSTLPIFRRFASSAFDSCAGSARAWREPQASALEVVEKVVALTRLLRAPRKEPTGIFGVHRHIPTSSNVHASPLTSEQAFNALSSSRFMIAHRHHSLSSRR